MVYVHATGAMSMKHNGTRLDTDSLHILSALKTHNTLNTSEVKSTTGIDDNDRVRRRLNWLADADLVELGKDEDADTPIPPTQATITDEGLEKADEWDIGEDTYRDTSTEERLDRIERRLDDFDDRISSLEEAATSGPDDWHDLEEARRVVVAMREYLVDEHNVDFGPYYPTETSA